MSCSDLHKSARSSFTVPEAMSLTSLLKKLFGGSGATLTDSDPSGAFRPDAARGDQFHEGDAQAAQSGDPEDKCEVGDMASSSEDSAG